MSAVPKNLRAFAGMLESISEAITVLDKVESIEQFTRENESRVAALSESAEAHRAELSKLQIATAQARAEALTIVEQAKVDGEAIKAKAAGEAQEIRSAAAEITKVAKAKEETAKAAEAKAWACTKAGRAELEALAPQLADAKATIAKAEAIKRAMG
jgi:hypothetical protein